MCGMGSVFSDVCVLTNTLKRPYVALIFPELSPYLEMSDSPRPLTFLGSWTYSPYMAI